MATSLLSLCLFGRPSEAANKAENHTESEQYTDITMYKSKQVIITKYKYLATVLTQIFQVSVLYLSVYFSEKFYFSSLHFNTPNISTTGSIFIAF